MCKLGETVFLYLKKKPNTKGVSSIFFKAVLLGEPRVECIFLSCRPDHRIPGLGTALLQKVGRTQPRLTRAEQYKHWFLQFEFDPGLFFNFDVFTFQSRLLILFI